MTEGGRIVSPAREEMYGGVSKVRKLDKTWGIIIDR